MKKYRVNVNGTKFEVEIEPIDSSEVSTSNTTSVTKEKTQSNPVNGGNSIKAPMPGTILKIAAAQGDTVKRGDLVMILEALKMENEILAPQDGTITSIAVHKGASVESGDLLYTIE